MSDTEIEATPERRKWLATTISAVAIAAVLGGGGFTIVKANADAQVRENAAQAMSAAAPAYQGAISLGGDLDDLAVKSVQAKAVYDAEQARIAAEQAAAAEAARVAAEQVAAQQAAAEQAAQQQTQRQTATNDAPAGPIKCPSNTHPNAVDGNGNESNCEANGPGGEICQAYDANNNCTNWYKP
jgi:hypothetical protein